MIMKRVGEVGGFEFKIEDSRIIVAIQLYTRCYLLLFGMKKQ